MPVRRVSGQLPKNTVKAATTSLPEFTQTIHVPSSANDCEEWKGREIQLWGKPRFYEGLSATQVMPAALRTSLHYRGAAGKRPKKAQSATLAPRGVAAKHEHHPDKLSSIGCRSSAPDCLVQRPSILAV